MIQSVASLALSAILAATANSIGVDISGPKDINASDATRPAKEVKEKATNSPPTRDVNKDFPITAGSANANGLGATYYNVPWTLTTNQYFRDESYSSLLDTINDDFPGFPIEESDSTSLTTDDYLILPLNESIDNVSFCVNPGCVTYIWSKFKVCFVTETGNSTTSGGSSSNIFINVISDGANIETPKAVCDTTP